MCSANRSKVVAVAVFHDCMSLTTNSPRGRTHRHHEVLVNVPRELCDGRLLRFPQVYRQALRKDSSGGQFYWTAIGGVQFPQQCMALRSKTQGVSQPRPLALAVDNPALGQIIGR